MTLRRRSRRRCSPIAGRLRRQVDKEMTVFIGAIHLDNLEQSGWSVALEQLLHPGLREEDFTRVKEAPAERAGAGPARQQRRGPGHGACCRPRSTPARPTSTRRWARWPGSRRSRCDDVRALHRPALHAGATSRWAWRATCAATLERRLRRALSGPAGRRRARRRRRRPAGRMPAGREAMIVSKDTRATAISLGFPIAGHARASRLRGAVPGAHLAGRAPLVDEPPLPAHPRGARA